MNKMSPISRIIIAVGSLSLIATFLLPFWFIFLIAPQYPEGLTMNIWLNKITGQVEIINGLNHYIGMKHINADMFPEFGYLVYIVGAFILLGLVVAILGNRKLLLAYIILIVAGGVAAMVDFYLWGYDYGHNLDPKAAIQVPGLSYQPPLIGHKTLLNFDAYSYPDTGGWVAIVAVCLFIGVWIFEWRRARKISLSKKGLPKKVVAAAAIMLAFLTSCSSKPQLFQYGKDICDDCKMTIMDPKFGGEIITKKGRIYKFDDAHCLANFIKKGNIKETDIAQTLFIDYNKENSFINAATTSFVVSPQLKSPMNSNAAAFASKTVADQKVKETDGSLKNWPELRASL